MRLRRAGPFVTPTRPPRGRDAPAHDPRAGAPSGSPSARVWAGPRSLAATGGVSVDFLSSGYLDVSVPPVAPDFRPCGGRPPRVPPFGHPRISGRVRLPGEYRCSPRPSSASRAKASAVRPGPGPALRGARRPGPPGRQRGAPSRPPRISIPFAAGLPAAFPLCGSQGARGVPRGPDAAGVDDFGRGPPARRARAGPGVAPRRRLRRRYVSVLIVFPMRRLAAAP